MAKDALYLVHAELEGSYVDEWNAWHARRPRYQNRLEGIFGGRVLEGRGRGAFDPDGASEPCNCRHEARWSWRFVRLRLAVDSRFKDLGHCLLKMVGRPVFGN